MAGERGLAEDLRARLENDEKPKLKLVDMNEAKEEVSYLDEIFHDKPVRWHIAQFGLMWLAISLLIGAYVFWKGRSYADLLGIVTTGLIIAWVGYRVPVLLLSVWRSWMKLAEILGLIVTPIVMTLLWCITFIPFGLGLRLFGKKVMNTEFRTDAETYWLDRDIKKNDILLLRKQF